MDMKLKLGFSSICVGLQTGYYFQCPKIRSNEGRIKTWLKDIAKSMAAIVNTDGTRMLGEVFGGNQ